MIQSTPVSQLLKTVIRDIPDFPKPGIVFKDITPILKDPVLCTAIVDSFYQYFADKGIDVVVGVESRGFLFGMLLANRLGVPFVPLRKQGKLPAETISQTYDLEYGNACIEIHKDAFPKGTNVLIHDDLLATGGTIVAASDLVLKLGARIIGYAFVISLDFLGGKERLQAYSPEFFSVVNY